MAVGILARAAVAAAVASALSLEPPSAAIGGAGSSSQVADAAVQAHGEGGCGEKVRGYQLHGEGVLYAASWRANARNTTDCTAMCDASADCIGFVVRRPKTRKVLCDLYKNLQQKHDPRAMSYSKCSKGLKCEEGLGFHRFEFSHAGTWRTGRKMEAKTRFDCSKFCRYDKACVGFSHRTTTGGDEQCIQYYNPVNKEARRGMRTQAYSKCSLER